MTFQGTVASRSYTSGTGWGTIPNDASATDIKACAGTYTAPTPEAPNATAQYEVILVPQNIASGFAVQFKVGNRTFKWTSDAEVELESGKQYTLELTAEDEVSGASFSSTPWGNSGNPTNVETE